MRCRSFEAHVTGRDDPELKFISSTWCREAIKLSLQLFDRGPGVVLCSAPSIETPDGMVPNQSHECPGKIMSIDKEEDAIPPKQWPYETGSPAAWLIGNLLI
jgi:hypothetical protein